MAIKVCEKCGKKLSTEAPICPFCAEKRKAGLKKITLAPIAALALAPLLSAFSPGAAAALAIPAALFGLYLFQSYVTDPQTIDRRRERRQRELENRQKELNDKFKEYTKFPYPASSKELETLQEALGRRILGKELGCGFNVYQWSEPGLYNFEVFSELRIQLPLTSDDPPEEFKEPVAQLMKELCVEFNRCDPGADYVKEKHMKRIQRGEDPKTLFPLVSSFFTLASFPTPYGEVSSEADKEVGILIDDMRRIQSGFHGGLLHRISRVEIAGPGDSAMDTTDLRLAEKVSPGLVKHTRRKGPINNDLRERLLSDADYACQICGARLENGATLEVEHIIPFSKGGTDDDSNLQILCATCNRKKAANF